VKGCHRVSKLIGSHGVAIAVLTALMVLAIAGCGGDDDDDGTATTTTPTQTSGEPTSAASSRIDSALTSCTDVAQGIGGTEGTNLAGACAYVATAAEQALSGAGENVSQALSDVARNCRSAVGQLPSGQAQDALSQFCDALANAG
jgi:hypothetical protein